MEEDSRSQYILMIWRYLTGSNEKGDIIVHPFKLINIGFGNRIPAGRMVALVSNESAPVKRAIVEARENKLLIDATHGRKTRAVIVMDSGHIVLSSIQPETIANRVNARVEEESDE